MVRITKRGITEGIENQLSTLLLGQIKEIKSKENLSMFLDQLLTPSEQIMVKKRLAIKFFLRAEKKVKEIREILDVTKATISFVRRGLKNNPKKEKKIVIPESRGRSYRRLRYKGW